MNEGARQLREYLDRPGQTVTSLAERCKVSRQAVYNWLEGQEPTLVSAIAIAAATGIDVGAWLQPCA